MPHPLTTWKLPPAPVCLHASSSDHPTNGINGIDDDVDSVDDDVDSVDDDVDRVDRINSYTVSFEFLS